jgi:PiT family inorganic phosphate transporter
LIDPEKLVTLSHQNMTPTQFGALEALAGESFDHKWQLEAALAEKTETWRMRKGTRLDKAYNKILEERLNYIYRTFHTENADSQPVSVTEL